MKDLVENFHKFSDEKKRLVKLLLKEQGIDINSKLILPYGRDKKLHSLSYAQQRLWFLEKLEPNSPLYIIPSGVKIVGRVNTEYLLNAMQLIVDRHEVLRTKFIESEGKGYQEIISKIIIDPIIYSIQNNPNDLENIIKDEFTKPFDLSELPLFRFIVVHLTEELTYLLLPMHHIISDNWSTGILIKEILEIYNHKHFDKELNLEKIDIQYLDYALWQKEWLNGAELQKQKEFWVDQLKGSNEVLEIISDKKRPIVQSYNGSFNLFSINTHVSMEVEKYCKNNDITPFVLFLSVYQFLLAKYSHQNDVNIGVPIANRNRSEIEPLIGFFINTLVFRGIINFDDTVEQFLHKNNEVAHQAYGNQDIPFEMIVDELGLERDMSHTALFQAMFVLNNAPMINLHIEGLELEPIDFDSGLTKFDLILSLTKNGEEYRGKLEFNTDLFYKETIENIIIQYNYVLKEFLVSKNTKLKNIQIGNNEINTESKSSIKLNDKENFIHHKFKKVAKESSQKTAISDGINSYTYRELDSISDSIANELISKGIKPEKTVGVFINRRIEYVAAILGIFKSGGVLVPLDVTLPKEKLKYIIKDACIESVITNKEYLTELDFFNGNIINLDEIDSTYEVTQVSGNNLIPNNAAYIIYTSGSSGLPKGVVVEHDKFCYHVTGMIDEFGINENDKYLAFAAFNFDPSLEQLFVPFLAGAEVFLRDDNYWVPNDFIELIKKENITVINPPTVYWNQFVLAIKKLDVVDLGKLRLVISGGEEMKPEMFLIWNEKNRNGIELINAYGPTETLITSTKFRTSIELSKEQPLHIPIGESTCSRSMYIIDEYFNLVPERMPGELCFGDELLARCYNSDQIQTGEKFIPNPFSSLSGSRMYRTGDLVRYNNDGIIEYLGRIDNQVKVRGFRIELGEIEEVLLENQLIEEAVVQIINKEDINHIVAYVISEENNIEEKLLKYCSTKLPNYMLPSRIISIDKLPININGKLDKKLLPIPDSLGQLSKKEFIEPRTDLERDIALIVGGILGITKVGINDNFFEMGGHSILAIKVISEVREKYGADIQLKSLFENPTVEGLSEAVVAEQSNLLEDDDLENLLSEIEEM